MFTYLPEFESSLTFSWGDQVWRVLCCQWRAWYCEDYARAYHAALSATY